MKFLQTFLACGVALAFTSCNSKQSAQADTKKSDTPVAPTVEKADPGYVIEIDPQDLTSIQKNILAAYNKGIKKVKIPEGIYHIPRPEKDHWHLHFKDLKDFEIDATGVTFIMDGRDKRAINFEYCENLIFRGGTFLREIPPFSQGKIIAIAEDRMSIDVQIDKGYPTDLENTEHFPYLPVLNVYQPGTRKLKPLVPDIYLKNPKLESRQRLSEDTFRFLLRAKLDPQLPVVVGDHLAWRGGDHHDFNVWCSKNVTAENVTIKNGAGIGFMELCGEGGNTYRNCSITYANPPAGATEQPLLGNATDGFHSASVRKGPTLENVHLEGMDDDAVNIHGTYSMLMEINGSTAVIDFRTPHRGARTPIPFASEGDVVRFYDKQGAYIDEAKVISCEPKQGFKEGDLGKITTRIFVDRSKAEYFEMKLDHPVAGVAGGQIANINQTGSGFVIRNCSFKNNRGHGIFIRASEGLIENTLLEGTLMAGIVIAPEVTAWNEADYAHNVTIRNCTIRNVGVGTQPWNSGLTVAGFEFGSFVPLPGGHRNIKILNNTFEDNRGVNLVLTSTIGVEIKGNKFIRPMHEQPFRVENRGITNDKALIWIRHASDVKISDNEVVSPGSYFGTLVDSDSTVLNATGLDNGIKK